ncbi:hypothetical protein C731_2181 [Mycolicibacterium hassiacum DSM 44199]|uniref:Uncharacterized protein n=1 Tax=Mycolicibacterium hassiacum (strain DSM 44199 / CIP 105218 / JCM 12690 / 3849) TaxID=1122247 RepID=K5B8J6_MYCHD|nr:hypothetical protein C731_2181 [Mycolicibacterium hassiacum DSM 44199]
MSPVPCGVQARGRRRAVRERRGTTPLAHPLTLGRGAPLTFGL